jgi:peptidyl-prolyl cis-trans isomerase A (cyclophilin A)
MKRITLYVLLLLAVPLSFARAGVGEVLPRVLIETDAGAITLELYQDAAPVTVNHFLRYVDGNHYSRGAFYRVVRLNNQAQNPVKIEVIQGGLGMDAGTPPFKPIAHESTRATGVRHTAGVISMARLEPGSASSEFFICVTDQPELDYGGHRNPDGQGFAAFGKVIEGLEVVRRIQQLKTDTPAPGQLEYTSGQMLLEPVRIRGIKRLDSQLESDKKAINTLLDNFHDAADKGDKARYLGYFTSDGVFMGTDDWERWPLEIFTQYVSKRFKDGKGWSYRSVERHVNFSPSGDTAWFDEITESAKWGRFRGTGVLVKQQEGWRLAHYAMSFLLPNEIWPQVTEMARDAVEKRQTD